MARLIHIVIIGVALCCIQPLTASKAWPLPMDSADVNSDTITYGASVQAVAASGDYAPFWFHSNRYGAVSAQPYSGQLSVSVSKELTRPRRWYDYSFGIEAIGQVNTNVSSLFFQQLYAHLRLYVIDITVGVKPETWGNQDEFLSSGGFLFSQNARPMPRITIGIDHYVPVPFTYGYLELKGGITHAWFTDNVYLKNSFLHHKFIGARVGGNLPVTVNYEFHHAAQWGGVSPVYGELGSSFKDFVTVFFAGSGGTMSNDQINAYGNHLGSQSLGLDVKVGSWTVSTYWQNIFEDGPIKPLWEAMNISDGVWGLSIKQSKFPYVSGLLYEFVNTTDQSGPFHDKDGLVFGGNDSYFTNSVYANGWNYFNRTLGTPFITSPIYNTDGSIATLNNRAMAHHLGIRGDIAGYRYRTLVSYAKNYGRYRDGDALKSTNTAILLEVNKQVPQWWNLDFSLSLGADLGTQFGNSFGVMFSVAKRGIIWSY